MKRLMIIAGGEWQVPIIRKAKEMGLYVINTNLYPNSPGFEFADVGLLADVLDRDKNLEYARQYSADAVLTDQSDIAVPTVAYVAEELGLEGIGGRTAALFTDKHLMRRFCADQGFPTPAFQLCQDLSDANAFAVENGLPCVVKPPASQSSRGVAKVGTQEELARAYDAALSHSQDGTVLVEGFIGGVELTVDGIQLNAGGHHCLATSCKTHYAHNEMVASQLLFVQRHPHIDFDELHAQHNRLIREMRLPFGLTHAEYKYYEGNFYLVEVAARGGGTRLSSDIVPLMSGIDNNALLIRMALGERISELAPSRPSRACALDFFQFSPGTIRRIAGVEQALAIEGVVALGMGVHVGEVVRPASDDRSRHGFVIAHADSLTALDSLLCEIHRTVQVQYE